MGVLLFDKNADFSGMSLGHAGLYTSVSDNLLGLFELRRSASKARKNSAPEIDAEALITGSPSFSAVGVDLTAVGQIMFPGGPSNGGENTLAMIVKVKNGGALADVTVGSVPAARNVNGALFFTHWNRRTRIETTLFDAQSGTPNYSQVVSASLDVPFDGSLDGTHQLFVATVKSEDAVRIYWPAVSQMAEVPLSSGQFAYFNRSAVGTRYKSIGAGSTAHNLSMFAYWDRALSAAEVATFHRDLKKQFSLIGFAI